MALHPINDIMETSIKNLRSVIDVNEMIGDPITAPNGTVIIPISKVTFGFASGGSDIPSSKQPQLFGGGAGSGVTMTPVGMIVIYPSGKVELLQLATADNTADRVVNMVPGMLDKLTGAIKSRREEKSGAE